MAKPAPLNLRDPSLWVGGYYELSIKLGPADDHRLAAAYAALIQSAEVRLPQDATSHDGSIPPSLLLGGVRGIVQIPSLGRTLALVHAVREDLEATGQPPPSSDWLNLCLPLGALAELDGRVGGYPFGETTSSQVWRAPIEDWFARIGGAVFDVVPFAHAVTGFEVAGDEATDARDGRHGLLRPGRDGTLQRTPRVPSGW